MSCAVGPTLASMKCRATCLRLASVARLVEDSFSPCAVAVELVPPARSHIQASACCKHYVANSMESSTVDGVHHERYEYDAQVSMQDLVDSYMAPFQVMRLTPRTIPPRKQSPSPYLTRSITMVCLPALVVMNALAARAHRQACVERGRVSGLMCSYNAVNGVPSCANDWLLDDVARRQWGFDGCVLAPPPLSSKHVPLLLPAVLAVVASTVAS